MLRILSLGVILSFTVIVSAVAQESNEAPFEPRLVLIIDDMGYNLAKGEAALSLPGAVTFSILPFTPYAERFARDAHARGREVMLHAPMSNTVDKALGPGGLTAAMGREQVRAELNAALDSVPYVSGINNHMGSLLTGMPDHMQWVMDTLKARNLYFIDSVTTVKTVGWKIARENNIPYLKRHVFLDHLAEREFIHKQFNNARRIAQKMGYAVVIGHPYPETIAYLKQVLPDLEGVRLVSASEIIQPEVKRQLTVRAQRRVLLADVSEK